VAISAPAENKHSQGTKDAGIAQMSCVIHARVGYALACFDHQKMTSMPFEALAGRSSRYLWSLAAQPNVEPRAAFSMSHQW